MPGKQYVCQENHWVWETSGVELNKTRKLTTNATQKEYVRRRGRV